MRLYAPDGTYLVAGDIQNNNNQNNHDNVINTVADQGGLYTVVVSSYFLDAEGSYRLHYLSMPGTFTVPGGDEGGPLASGGNHEGMIPVGDLDPWTFTAKAGDQILLRAAAMTSTTGDFRPRVRLYAPGGAFLATGDIQNNNNQNNHDNVINTVADQGGLYTVVVSSHFLDAEGSYRLHHLKVPGAFTVPGGDEGGALSRDNGRDGAIAPADMDVWTFEADQGNSLTVSVLELTGVDSFSPRLQIYDPSGLLVATHAHPTLARTSFAVRDSGIFTVVIDSGILDGSGTYRVAATGLPEQGKQLRVSRHRQNQEETVTVNWPSALAGAVLQQNSVLATNGWEDVGVIVSDSGLNARITVPVETEGRRFFRLKP